MPRHRRTASRSARDHRLAVGIIGDSHVNRIRNSLSTLNEDLGFNISIRARGGAGILNPPCSPRSVNCDLALVVLGGNNLSKPLGSTPEELATKLYSKFKGVGKVVVFCSVWNRLDIDTFDRKHFNRKLQQLCDDHGQGVMYHRMDRKLNSKLRADGVHLTPVGEHELIMNIRRAINRGLESL